MGKEFNYSLDLIWPAKTQSCSRSLSLERAAFRRRIPGRLFSDMNLSFVSFSPKKEGEEKIKRASVIKTFCDFPKHFKTSVYFRLGASKVTNPTLKVLILISMRMFSAWNPERAVANLLLWNCVISQLKECLFKQSLRGLVNSRWHLKAFVDTAVLIWKEWLPINRILKWAVESETSGMWAEWLTGETSAPSLEAHSIPPLSDAPSGMTCPTLTLHLGPRGDSGPLALSPAPNQRHQRLRRCLYPCIHVKIKSIRVIRYSYMLQKTMGSV